MGNPSHDHARRLLAQNLLGIALDAIEIDLNAEAGPHRSVHQAMTVDLDILNEAELVGRVRQQHLEVFAIAVASSISG